ncbi:follitropin subunit beta [Heliangelus exortis]|uniref:follitropin subunit beta n=1 Tax=Heliangelus exortis TaxID=472823 RepID=UPI003A8EEC5F
MKTINCYMLLFCWKLICCNSCQLTNITIAVEKEECEFCITVNATWCSGYCFTRDPVYKYPPVSSVQQTCTFKEVVYETVKIPGCGNHPESFYSYPVATECHCETCDTDTTDCTVRGLGPSYCSFSQNGSNQ